MAGGQETVSGRYQPSCPFPCPARASRGPSRRSCCCWPAAGPG